MIFRDFRVTCSTMLTATCLVSDANKDGTILNVDLSYLDEVREPKHSCRVDNEKGRGLVRLLTCWMADGIISFNSIT